ncbi:MAG: hypothetical protein ACTSYM_05310 [Candidatus Baldrarchaeia archaeon]
MSIVEELGMLVTISYNRDGGRIDPVITSKSIIYGLSVEQLGNAETVRTNLRSIRLSEGIPRNCYIVPIRYVNEGYVAPAIGKVLLRMTSSGGFRKSIDYDIDIDEFYQIMMRENIENVAETLATRYLLPVEDLKPILNDLRNMGDVWRDHIEEGYGYIVLAKTMILFTEDIDVADIDGPLIDREFAAQLFNDPEITTNIKKYTGIFRPIRGFIGNKAIDIIIHLTKSL